MELPDSIKKNFLLVIILLILSIVIVGLLFEKKKLETEIDLFQEKIDNLNIEKEALSHELNQAKISTGELNSLKKEKMVLDQELLHAKASVVKGRGSGFPSAKLWIDKEKVINRSEVKNGSDETVQWVILHNGTVALKKNAHGKKQYKKAMSENTSKRTPDQFRAREAG